MSVGGLFFYVLHRKRREFAVELVLPSTASIQTGARKHRVRIIGAHYNVVDYGDLV